MPIRSAHPAKLGQELETGALSGQVTRPSDAHSVVFRGESPDGTLTEGRWNRWTQGVFRAAKLAVGLPTSRAYDLRHSFVSLLIHRGQSILEVARQAGHSPQTCLRDYGHLFDEFDPAEREAAEAVIGAAREISYISEPAKGREAARRAKNPYSGISHSGNRRSETASTLGALRAMKPLHKERFRGSGREGRVWCTRSWST
jgi:hypothetical protein